MNDIVTVTGAFSYTGKYTARLLLDRGYRVRTLTHHPERANPFAEPVEAFPYNFDHPDELRASLGRTATLINTYWVRFPHRDSTFAKAVRNTRILIEAAKQAGVRRMVHVSIANPSAESPLGYYRGKQELERAVMDSGLAYTIVRPTVIFGTEDILINNLAWLVRRLPLFGIPGDGRYTIRPIYVEDMARLLADAVDARSNELIDAVGPETYTFEDLVRLIARGVGRPLRLVHMPASLAYLATLVTGWFVGDVVLTREEYRGLMGNLLAPEGPSAGKTRLSEWLAEHGEAVGKKYQSELARHYLAVEKRHRIG